MMIDSDKDEKLETTRIRVGRVPNMYHNHNDTENG